MLRIKALDECQNCRFGVEAETEVESGVGSGSLQYSSILV